MFWHSLRGVVPVTNQPYATLQYIFEYSSSNAVVVEEALLADTIRNAARWVQYYTHIPSFFTSSSYSYVYIIV